MEGLLTGRLLNRTTARLISNDGERQFATYFIDYLPHIPLYYEPDLIEVPGHLRKTKPDFVTPFFLYQGLMYYEVTITENTYGNGSKPEQYGVLRENKLIHPNQYHLEINGNGLRLPDMTMGILENMYEGRIQVRQVQKMINGLGRNQVFLQSVLVRLLC